jgi:hypothetical protein
MEHFFDMPLKVLIMNEDGMWVVLCLQFDIAAQGKSLGEAVEGLEHLLLAREYLDRRKGRAPFSTLSPAPKSYWELFDEGLEVSLPIDPCATFFDAPRTAMKRAARLAT